MGLLYKFAFNPLMRMQKARQAEIHQSIVDAENLRDEAQQLLADYKRQLAQARQEADAIVERARKAGETSKAEVLEEARVQAEATLAKARQQIERDTNQALQQIREEAADLAIAATPRWPARACPRRTSCVSSERPSTRSTSARSARTRRRP